MSVARITLGISAAEFWSLTPAQFFAMCGIRKDEELVKDYRAGIITCYMKRFMGDKNAQPLDDFGHKKRRKPPRNPTAEEIRAQFRALGAKKDGG